METRFMQEAFQVAREGMDRSEGGPFGCVIVKNGVIIGRGHNRVIATNDPTAHAEVEAIREACRTLQSFQLEGCEIYTTCEPCPMCLGAIYWARPSKVYYASTRMDAAQIGFDDKFIYDQLLLEVAYRSMPMEQILLAEGKLLFREWLDKGDKAMY
ncbi:MAG TPA: nucleoside deaminase [Saprospiraceae bacterium]|nr:nucleoside deaminase [Saprospiraceae bacterium]